CQADATCGGGTPKNCSALDDACTKGVCDPRDGQCGEQPADDPQCTDSCLLIKGALVCPTYGLVCGVGSCVPDSKDACSIGLPTPPVIVIIVIGSPGASCTVRIRETRPGQNAL